MKEGGATLLKWGLKRPGFSGKGEAPPWERIGEKRVSARAGGADGGWACEGSVAEDPEPRRNGAVLSLGFAKRRSSL